MTDTQTPRLLEVTHLTKAYRARVGGRRTERLAVNDVSFAIEAGQTFGLVGESGSGKSTIGRAILRLVEPDAGTVSLRGTDVRALSRTKLRQIRSEMQMVFQDPYSSLNPRIRVGDTIREAMEITGRVPRDSRRAARDALLEDVGLAEEFAGRFPHELSGGQRQRIAIARTLAVRPSLIVLDEPTSALDVSVQGGILKLLTDLQAERNLGYLFISHDMAVVRAMADVVGVMQNGSLVEVGTAHQVFDSPQHPYTQRLLQAVPRMPEHLGSSLLGR